MASILSGIALAGTSSIGQGDDFQRAAVFRSGTASRTVASDDAQARDAGSAASVGQSPTASSRTSSGTSSLANNHKNSDQWRLRWRSPGEPDSGETNEVPTPAKVGAVQLASAASSRPRSSGVSQAVMIWDDATPRGKSPVHLTSQLERIDPFDDPFGDRANSANRLSAPIATQEREIAQPLPAPKPSTGPGLPELPRAPMSGGALAPGKDAQPTDPAPALPFGQLPPDGFDFPSRQEPPCDRTYNRRNCCVDDERCEFARTFVRNDKITNILLDITPSFTNTDPVMPNDVAMRRELTKAPSRVWKDRVGRQIAEGSLFDYQYGRVHITTPDGQTVRIPFRDLSDDDLCFLTSWWGLPSECPLTDDIPVSRNWVASSMTWKASALCHKPLYFQDVDLERYGHTSGPFTEPFVSIAHFFGSLVTVPYQMGMHPPQECVYTLGHYRPGSCAPWLIPGIPISLRGGLAQAGAVVGGIFIIP